MITAWIGILSLASFQSSYHFLFSAVVPFKFYLLSEKNTEASFSKFRKREEVSSVGRIHVKMGGATLMIEINLISFKSWILLLEIFSSKTKKM